MNLNPEIFKAYDIRGVYPEDLDKDTAYNIGKAFVCFLRKNRKKKNLKIAVARDARLSSPLLFKGFSKGVLDQGCDIIDIGLVPTPMLYFAVSNYGYDGGAIITASHNPNPYNGFKLTKEKAIPLAGPSGIFWMRDYILSEKEKEVILVEKGKIIKKDIEKDYMDLNFKMAKVKKGEFKGLSLALDAGNGVGGPIALKLLKSAGVKIFPLYVNPDGSFPNHAPNPLIEENIKDLITLVREKNPSLGVALDGDADRIRFIDEKGNAVSGDLITGLMAKILLKKNKKIKIIYDIRSSNAVREAVNEAGGTAIVSCIGHSLIKEKMREEDILFGGELSGHYYFGKDLFYEVPFYVIFLILREIKEGKIMSGLIDSIKKYYQSGEINFKVNNKERKIKEIKNLYSDGELKEIDGVRIDFKDWWFLVRASNTEPVLRLVIEAKSKELLEEKKEELAKLIMQ
ncbi:MAG: phosphomannomutase/phosphoglucomutase [Candidatus Parcubacteria bacterium]|nr:phosphomannomutase/phosphoglucomutase [Candidatus Parcubacteria bacterium]